MFWFICFIILDTGSNCKQFLTLQGILLSPCLCLMTPTPSLGTTMPLKLNEPPRLLLLKRGTHTWSNLKYWDVNVTSCRAAINCYLNSFVCFVVVHLTKTVWFLENTKTRSMYVSEEIHKRERGKCKIRWSLTASNDSECLSSVKPSHWAVKPVQCLRVI